MFFPTPRGRVPAGGGDAPRTALATAERANLINDPGMAMASARAAMAGLPPGSPDWIRAQDILLVSQTAWDELKRKGKVPR